MDRADGTLQEELQLIHGFLGDDVFKIMVIIATNTYKQGKAESEIDQDDLNTTKEVIVASLKEIVNADIDWCPPIVYIPFNEQSVLKKIKGSSVLFEIPLMKLFIIQPSNSATIEEATIIKEIHEKKDCRVEVHVQCKKCGNIIICTYLQDKNIVFRSRVIVKDECGIEYRVSYGNSKCHPNFYPRHTPFQKVIGGIIHVISLGTIFIFQRSTGRKFWPFFNDEEKCCEHCHKNPKEEPCLKVGRFSTDHCIFVY